MSVPKASVLGWPIEHSKSPTLHGHWLEKYGLLGEYSKVSVEPEKFEGFVRDLVKDGWRGANVTIPHKEAALALADEATPRAKAIGAANTLIFKDGKIKADNTDGFGFVENLRDRAGDVWDPKLPAAVFGAGGAARAILFALLEAGAPEIRLLNRTRSRADELCKMFGPKIRVLDWGDDKRAVQGAGLLVNTTSLGMIGQPPLEIEMKAAPKTAVATDIVYTPLETPFLKAAAAMGLTTVDGLGMLIHQGRPGFEAWFGKLPEADETVRELLLAS